MKINLLINGNGFMNDYLNIDPVATTNGPDIYRGDITNLDEFVDDGEATEIRAIGALEYYPGRKVDGIVKNWIKKLSHNGRLSIGFTDVYEVNRALQNRIITIHQYNDLVYGHQVEEWDFKKCCFHLNQMADFLTMYK